MPVDCHAREYKMDHTKRGLALIFNHEDFMGRLESRNGSYYDCTELEKTFKYLKFDVKIYKDCTLQELMQHMNNAAQDDHTDSDCIAITLLTHGEKGGVVNAKDHSYTLDDVFQKFTPEKCPTLAGKPKLFFIQACRGVCADSGYKLKNPTQTDGQGLFTTTSIRIPLQADFLIAYCTVPEYVSYRKQSGGAHYIRSLVKEFNENGKIDDILTLLTFVNQHLAIEYESHVPNDPEYDNKKQMPCFTSMLTRLLYFKDKN